MFALGYLLWGLAFWAFKIALAVTLIARARSRGLSAQLPEPSVAAHVVGILFWPIEAAVMAWKLAAIFSSAFSAWLTSRRLRGEP